MTNAEVLALLALENESSVEQIKLIPAPQLFTEERILRISGFIGIYIGVHTLYENDLADHWIKRPNHNQIFNGLSPLESVMRDGLNAINIIKSLIDARCAGN